VQRSAKAWPSSSNGGTAEKIDPRRKPRFLIGAEGPGREHHGHRQVLGIVRRASIGYAGGRVAGRGRKTTSSLLPTLRQPIFSGQMKINLLPAGFVIPARPVLASKPPAGTDWVHEIKHDGYRMIVHRDGPTVRLYSRNANDWTARLSAIATAARQIKAKSFTIDGEAVVLGPDGLSRLEELQRRTAAHAAILYAFDLIEHDGEDLRERPFLDRKAALARLLGGIKMGILLNEHVAEDGPTVFAHACQLGAEGIVSKEVDGTYCSGPCRVWIKVRNPASIAVQRERREIWNRRASGSARHP
jgi:bifunctional non-homologous end joining protein LigD